MCRVLFEFVHFGQEICPKLSHLGWPIFRHFCWYCVATFSPTVIKGHAPCVCRAWQASSSFSFFLISLFILSIPINSSCNFLLILQPFSRCRQAQQSLSPFLHPVPFNHSAYLPALRLIQCTSQAKKQLVGDSHPIMPCTLQWLPLSCIYYPKFVLAIESFICPMGLIKRHLFLDNCDTMILSSLTNKSIKCATNMCYKMFLSLIQIRNIRRMRTGIFPLCAFCRLSFTFSSGGRCLTFGHSCLLQKANSLRNQARRHRAVLLVWNPTHALKLRLICSFECETKHLH